MADSGVWIESSGDEVARKQYNDVTVMAYPRVGPGRCVENVKCVSVSILFHCDLFVH